MSSSAVVVVMGDETDKPNCPVRQFSGPFFSATLNIFYVYFFFEKVTFGNEMRPKMAYCSVHYFSYFYSVINIAHTYIEVQREREKEEETFKKRGGGIDLLFCYYLSSKWLLLLLTLVSVSCRAQVSVVCEWRKDQYFLYFYFFLFCR